MNLLIFSPYYPPHTGGLESHSDEFNKHFAATGAHITVFTPRLPRSAPKNEVRYERVRVIRFPAFEAIPNFPVPKIWSPVFREQWRELHALPHDTVISRTRFFLTSLLAWRFARQKKLPWIHIEHGSEYVKLTSRLATLAARLYDETFGRFIFRGATQNIAISEAVKKFIERFDRREVAVIYRGMDFEFLDSIVPSQEIRKRYADKVLLVTAARLYKWKGIEYTIRAIQELPSSLKEKIIFLVVGDGEDRSHLERLADGAPIVFLGARPRQEVISVFKSSDIYIHSSLPGGGLSTSLLEAMHSGCAVIATPNEGADEVIQHQSSGLLVSSPYEENIGKAILTLVHDPDQKLILAQNARTSVDKKFSWQTSVEHYIEYLRNLL